MAELLNVVGVEGFIFKIQRFALHDGPGIRTVVFFKGCNLACDWCSNPESQNMYPQLLYDVDKCIHCLDCVSVCPSGALSSKEGNLHLDRSFCNACGDCTEVCRQEALSISGRKVSIQDVMAEVVKDFDYYQNSGGGLTLSGGEPLIQFPFAIELLKEAKRHQIHTCIETAGHINPGHMEAIASFTDLFLFDYKLSDQGLHLQYTGVKNHLILDNLELLDKSGSDIILRCPIIPGINDTQKHFQGIADVSNRYHSIRSVEIMPYHNYGNFKYKQLGRETPILQDSVEEQTKNRWIAQLKRLGCEKTEEL